MGTRKLFSSCIFLFYFLLAVTTVVAQQKYTYKQSKIDFALAGKAERFFDKDQIDSGRIYLNQYKNRLGYTFYRLKAIEESNRNVLLSKAYLDSAFARGMTPHCVAGKKYFDPRYIYESYSRNFLSAYDTVVINSLDSMQTLDQLYRKQMVTPEGIKNMKQFKKSQTANDSSIMKPEDPRQKQINDSLSALQYAIDSTNQKFLFHMIWTKGWPSAKMIGRQYCSKSAPDPWLFFAHITPLEKNKRFQFIMLIKFILPLCEKNEEDWFTAERYMWSIHNRSRKDFNEFALIKIKGGVLDREASYFSAVQMAESVVKCSTEQMEIRCKDFSLFEQVRDYLIELGGEVNLQTLNHIYEMEGWPLPHHPTKDNFTYVPSTTLNVNIIEFRFVPL